MEIAPFDRSHTSSYSSSIVTMALSRIICESSDILVENPEIYIPRRNFVKMFDAGKNKLIGLPYGEKIMTIR